MLFRFGKREVDFAARTHIMGILNVTPDSFSDGGKYLHVDDAVAHALAMVDAGADFIDIGGESTRPKGNAYGKGALPITAEEEMRRVIPVIERLAARTDIPLSIDTYKASVAEAALGAGAVIVNDISGFRFDPAMAGVVGKAGASAVLMHIKGTPQTMQSDPSYGDLFGEILEYLRESLNLGRTHGVSQMMIDPGLGFGKTQSDNLRLVSGLVRFAELGYPIVVGPSRKSFIGNLLNLPIEDRVEGTLAASVLAIAGGARVLRVHDVQEVKRAAVVADAIVGAAGT
jgi:dihydropteroate synthase